MSAVAPMRTQTRMDWRLLLLMVLAAAALVAVAFLNSARPVYSPNDPRSSASDGTKALWLWLEALGYSVEHVNRTAYMLPDDAGALFVFSGLTPYSSAEATSLARWLEAGHTVVFVDPPSSGLAYAFLDYHPVAAGLATTVVQAQPLLPGTPAEWTGVSGIRAFRWHPGSKAVAVMVRPDGSPSVMVRERGAGTLWYLSDLHSLTNESLRNPNQASIVAAILRTIPPGSTILFDAYHFYGASEQGERLQSLQELLYRTAVGRALLFLVGLGAIYWFLAGRRLGPPVPPLAEVRRREAADYVRAMAGLKRRAHTMPEVAAHHRQRLKSALARTRALDPRIDDRDFTRRLRAHTVVDGSLDAAALAEVEQLLAALHAPADEQTLVRAAAGVDAFLKKYR